MNPYGFCLAISFCSRVLLYVMHMSKWKQCQSGKLFTYKKLSSDFIRLLTFQGMNIQHQTRHSLVEISNGSTSHIHVFSSDPLPFCHMCMASATIPVLN